MTSSNNHDREAAGDGAYGARALRWLSRLFLLAGCAAILWSLYFWAAAEIYQRTERRHFEEMAASQRLSPSPLPQEAAPVVEEPVPMAPGFVIQEDLLKKEPASRAVLGQMAIPRIGLSVIVAEGDSPAVLLYAAGHLKGTARPGEYGNVAIAAHRDTFFRSLQNIRENDSITLTTLEGTYRYEVESIAIVEPEDTEVLAASAEPTLTLITCYPFYYIGPAPKRFVVRAREISQLP